MGHYGESHEEGRAFIGDGMQVKRSNDVPMSATWTQKPGVNNDQPGYNADVRESAFSGPYLWPEPGGGGIHDRVFGCMGVVASNAQAYCRQGNGERAQPFRDSHLCTSAASGSQTRPLVGAIRTVVHPQ